MAGIYVHIPFCKKACHYCDFHFSTSLDKKLRMVGAICDELVLRKHEISDEITSIYFGGGTPSLLSRDEIQQIIQSIFQNYQISPSVEITLEANPDDLNLAKVQALKESGVNRLSIGIQSFLDKDLVLMNRSHNVEQALASIDFVRDHFKNYSIDLIYGIPGMSREDWNQNLLKAMHFEVPHLSSYALTVEPRTALSSMIEKGKIPEPDEDMMRAQYDDLLHITSSFGYDNYEFSNFCRDDLYSRNNTGYWFGNHYLGVGPSAHSFDGSRRKWNISNNSIYLNNMETGSLPREMEELSLTDHYNEHIMTRLRTKWGLDFEEIKSLFGGEILRHLETEASAFVNKGWLIQDEKGLKVSREGKFLTDGISADLFLVN